MIAGGLSVCPSRIVVQTNSSAAECDAYVANHVQATGYHRPAWVGVIQRAFGHRTRYLAAQSASGIVGVLPLVFMHSRLFGSFAVSIPFLNYGGMLCDGPEVERALLAHAIEETRNTGGTYVELRHTRRIFPELPDKRHKVTMKLALERSADRQWQRLDRKVRNQIRKAEDSRFEVEHGGLGLLPSFYTVFARNMRDLGTPVYSVGFFREVLSTFPDSTRVFIVRSAGRPVAAAILHWYRDTIEVPWASSIREFNAQCVNMLLYWHMLQFAIERDFSTFDFGRSTPGEGTFRFKEQWGAQPQQLIWEYWMRGDAALPNLNPKNPHYRHAIACWRRLPVRIATRVGPSIARSIP